MHLTQPLATDDGDDGDDGAVAHRVWRERCAVFRRMQSLVELWTLAAIQLLQPTMEVAISSSHGWVLVVLAAAIP